MNKKLLFGMFAVFLLILSIQSVYAIDILNSVLQPFRGTDVGKLYDTYSLFIDAILYLLLFLGLAQLVYVKLYGAKEGKLVAVAVGLALTFGMALLESRTGFRLGALTPIGAIILMFVFFVLLFNMFNSMFNDAGASFSLSFLIMYAFLMSAFKTLYDWLETNAPLLAALIQIAMVISFIVLIIKLIGMFKSGNKSDSSSTSTLGTTTPTLGEGGNGGGSKTPVVPGTIDITSPSEGQHFNAGDSIRVAFSVSGAGFDKHYDYEVLLNGSRFMLIQNVARNQVMPGAILAGTQARVGMNVIQVNALKRRLLGGTNSIFAQSAARNFTVGPGGPGGGSGGASGTPPEELVALITDYLTNAVKKLDQNYQQYSMVFSTIVGTHHDFVSGRRPDDSTSAEWNSLIESRTEMLKTASLINKLLEAIHSHTGYGLLTLAHLEVLAENVETNARLRRAIIIYEIQVRKEYIDHRAPSVPPRP